MIKVQLFGVARLQAGVGSFTTNVQTLDELKGLLPGISRKEANDLLVLVNGQCLNKKVSKKYRFQDGDTVVFLSPAGGG